MKEYKLTTTKKGWENKDWLLGLVGLHFAGDAIWFDPHTWWGLRLLWREREREWEGGKEGEGW